MSIARAIKDEADMNRLAEMLADISRPADIFLLEGGLGAGKTSFARAFLRRLAQDPDMTVPSPTYTLLQTYDLPKAHATHLDLYRLSEDAEIEELGLEEALAEKAILLVEWPDRADGYFGTLPETLRLAIMPADGNNPESRLVTLSPSGSWGERLKEAGLA